MKALFDQVSAECSKLTTRTYSTSFSLGIWFLNKRYHKAIYGIYGFVRLADEIVDSFHGYDKAQYLDQLREETSAAIDDGVSLNPILNHFQSVVHQYGIGWDLIGPFLESMKMDLHKSHYTRAEYERYIYGSAEVVGLMCLKVFLEGKHDETYETLKMPARHLGSAFQKVNFLRDLKEDHQQLGRVYFPGIDMDRFGKAEKEQIEREIEHNFDEAIKGIRALPSGSRPGVYLALIYYRRLFNKIRSSAPRDILRERVRIPDPVKIGLAFQALIRERMGWI